MARDLEPLTGIHVGERDGADSRRPTAVIEHVGQSIRVRPQGVAEVLAPLTTRFHLYHPSPTRGGSVVEEPRPLCQQRDDLIEPAVELGAGLEAPARRLLEAAGYGVVVTEARRRLRAPDLAAVGRHGLVDMPLHELVRRHDRGLVRHGPRVDPAWLAAQVALAYPKLRVAVVAATEATVVNTALRMRRFVPEARYVTGDRPLAKVGRVVVSTPWALGDPAVRYWRRQVVFVVDAASALGMKARFALHHENNARSYGLLDRDARPAPRDADLLSALYGFRAVDIPRPGHVVRPVEAVFRRFAGGPPLPPGLGGVDLKRRGLWYHPVRNRRAVRIAAALERGRRHDPRDEFADLAARMSGVAEPRLAILVEGLEHALAVQQVLPRWPIVVGADADVTGLGRHRAEVLDARRWEEAGPPDRAIVTLSGLDLMPAGDLDAVVRADGGIGVPDALASGLVTSRQHDRPLLLVDLDDRHHPRLRAASRDRRDSYTARGWAGDADPLDLAVERFLAERPGVTP